ncbi:MAG: sigma-70 family RNA polymerase sigma factor [Saprospiraceae bacterium]|nr:sigma-70 family RNA polymerase sigma factor [Saprospiraceae bacterium]
MSEQINLLEKLRLGDEGALRQAYLEHRSAFLRWATAITNAQEQDLLDFYQETLIIFYQNLSMGKIQHLDRGVAPYLFGIGKKLLLNRWLRVTREISLDPTDVLFLQQIDIPSNDTIDEEWKITFKKAMALLNENCRRILEWFYYHDCSIEVICERMGYSSEEVTRVTKMRCLKKLREIISSVHIAGA